jgi:hypothetical protein
MIRVYPPHEGYTPRLKKSFATAPIARARVDDAGVDDATRRDARRATRSGIRES